MTSITTLLSVLFLALTSVYFICLLKSNNKAGKMSSCLKIGVLVTFIAGIAVYAVILSNISNEESWLTIALMSVFSSAEMFLGSTRMFDNGFQDFLFVSGGNYSSELSNICLVCLTAVYTAALLSSGYLIFNFFFKYLSSSLWLKINKPKQGHQVHVFFGYNQNAKLLIKDLHSTHPEDEVIVIDYPGDEDSDLDSSVWKKLIHFLSQRAVNEIDGAIVLKSKTSLAEADSSDIYSSLGLKLNNWLTSNSTVYIISDNEQNNRLELRVLLQAMADNNYMADCRRIYCHGHKTKLDIETGIGYFHEETQEKNRLFPELIFQDTAKLSIRSLIKDSGKDGVSRKSALPVDYVSVARDENNQKLGYVTSEFNAVIIGLGQTGLEALKFLYEFSALPDSNGNIIPFSCTVFDMNLKNRKKDFYDELAWTKTIKGIDFFPYEVNTEEFWEEFESRIGNTNYIFVCLGDDKLNLSVTNSILNDHLKGRNTSDRFVIMVRQFLLDDYAMKTIGSINERNNGCVVPFGSYSEMWRYDVLCDESMRNEAIDFFVSYNIASTYPNAFITIEKPLHIKSSENWGDYLNKADNNIKKRIEADWISFLGNLTDAERSELEKQWRSELVEKWIAREKTIRTGTLAKRTKGIRQRTQDISNVLHMSTKLALLPETIIQDAKAVSSLIPGRYIDKLYEGDENISKIICSLAICEHLRWNASHRMLGYKLGIRTNDADKTHEFLKDYHDLPDEIKHYDWLVVKTTLKLLSEKTDSKE